MQNGLGGMALVVALVAIGVGVYALLEEKPGGLENESRIAALEDQVGRLEDVVERQRRFSTEQPSLLGLRTPGVSEEAGPADPDAPSASEVPDAAGAERTGAASGAVSPEEAERLKTLVEDAVEKKAAQMRVMSNKKPSIDVFAKMLDLTDEQRQAVEENVVRSQKEIRELLETPTADGSLLLDELVDVMADGIANPGKSPGRWAKLFGRIMSENIPGSDETYAQRAEVVKQRLRDDFKRSWRPAQYAIFEAWKMDPTEVQDIEDSPWKDLQGRIVERARQLGAKLPEER